MVNNKIFIPLPTLQVLPIITLTSSAFTVGIFNFIRSGYIITQLPNLL